MKSCTLLLLLCLPWCVVGESNVRPFQKRSIIQATLKHPSSVDAVHQLRGGMIGTSGLFVEAIGAALSFAQENAQLAGERRSLYQSSSLSTVGTLLLRPSRIARLSLGAFVLAEVAGQLGWIHDTNQDGKYDLDELQASAKHWWNKAQPTVTKVNNRFEQAWERARQDGGLLCASTWSSPQSVATAIQKLPSRYQFALGAGVGLIGSPLLWSLGMSALKLGTAVYVVSEANHYASGRPDYPSHVLDENPSFQNVHLVLERVRTTVRQSVEKPKQTWLAIYDEVDDYIPVGLDLPASIHRGLLVGSVIGFLGSL